MNDFLIKAYGVFGLCLSTTSLAASRVLGQIQPPETVISLLDSLQKLGTTGLFGLFVWLLYTRRIRLGTDYNDLRDEIKTLREENRSLRELIARQAEHEHHDANTSKETT